MLLYSCIYSMPLNAHRLKDYAEAYETVKTERNKLHSLIQCTAQLAVELREKIKVFKNEAEILRDSAVKKERCVCVCVCVCSDKSVGLS